MLCAAAILMITMGARQTLGLFVSPLNTSTGLGIASISFAMAIGQFMWGATQPVFGAIADKYGSARVLVFGGVLLFLGMVLTPFMKSEFGLAMTLGVLAAGGAGAGSFSILIGGTAQRLPPEKRAFAAGFINAGGSAGQFVFANLLQALISRWGWVVAMLTMAVTTLLTLPLAAPLRRRVAATAPSPVAVAGSASSPVAAPGASSSTGAASAVRPSAAAVAAPAAAVPSPGLGEQVRQALRDPSYLCLHAGFFTCGFHIAFLVTHLPGEVGLCGLPASVSAMALSIVGLFNIAGSLITGWLCNRYRMKSVLAVMYASRALLIVLYLMAPKTAMTFYIFAAGLGFTWLATVPPTAGLVGKLFGTRYLATLFGLTLLSHQIGGFLGAWLGGLAFERFGNYQSMWYIDIALALAAALVNLPIREAHVRRVPAVGAPA
ncbi:MFS transporter [Massilia arenosa]|uniref:MFS transporter n=2 Tax=Zemynaea arenosa TaxID=2561931 RepID=A0A4Y9SI29_9BURK|nr:MFS transporter [Massilia arenosa]